MLCVLLVECVKSTTTMSCARTRGDGRQPSPVREASVTVHAAQFYSCRLPYETTRSKYQCRPTPFAFALFLPPAALYLIACGISAGTTSWHRSQCGWSRTYGRINSEKFPGNGSRNEVDAVRGGASADACGGRVSGGDDRFQAVAQRVVSTSIDCRPDIVKYALQTESRENNPPPPRLPIVYSISRHLTTLYLNLYVHC